MNHTLALLAFAPGLLVTLPGQAQKDSLSRTIRIEIVRTEDGHTEREVITVPTGDPAQVENALREAGIWQEMAPNHEENVVIDMRKLRSDGGVLKDMSLAFVLPEKGPAKGKLGVYTESAEPSKASRGQAGARITSVVEGTAASRAGLREGDILTAVGDRTVDGPSTLMKAVRAHAPGEEVKITWYRDGRKMSAKIILDEAEVEWAQMAPRMHPRPPIPPVPPGAPAPFMGRYMTIPFDTASGSFLGVSGEDAEEGGAQITEVTEGSAADSMGVEVDDLIVEVDGQRVADFSDLAIRIGARQPGTMVRIGVMRDGKRLDLEGRLGERRFRWKMNDQEFSFAFPDTPWAPEVDAMSMRERAELQREMDQLRREMEELRRELRGDMMRRVTVLMSTTEISSSEAELLSRNGATGLANKLELSGLQCDPNPSQGTYQLRFEVPERGDLMVDVHDGKGERVYHETITGFKGRYERMLDLADLANGAYYLVITQNGRSVARKLMKQ